MANLKYISIFLIILFSTFYGFAQDIKITAKVDKNPVGVNERFSYVAEISGSVQNLPEIQLPEFENFAVVGGPSVSSSFQIINFNMKASKTYSMVLLSREVGTFQIGPSRVKYKGKTYRSNIVKITVKQQTGQGRASQGQGETSTDRNNKNVDDLSKLVFMRVTPSQKTAYMNEEITLRYKIYFRTNITNNEAVKVPEAVGCWVEEYPIPNRPRVYTEKVNGIQYNVAEIKKIAVFPSRPGEITISPLEMVVETVVRRRSRDPFDFFNDPFGKVVKKRVSSGAVTITSLPLPKNGQPAQFSGLVGDFNIHSSIDKEVSQTNEAISFKAKISGKGFLKFLNDLPVEFPPDFEVYEPKINESVSKSGSYITSNKEFEYVIIPRVAGNFRIDPFQLHYFNPDDKKYHTLKVPEYSIRVSKGKDLAVGTGSGTVLSKEEVKLLGSDIRYIKENVSDFHVIGSLPYQSLWFYVALIIPLAALISAWGYRNHQEKMTTNVQYARRRKAHKHAQLRLKQAKSYWKQGKVAEFYGAISNGLIGYVADKTNRSAAGMLRDDVIELLQGYAVDDNLQKEYLQCLDEADFRRFATGQMDNGDMKSAYQNAEQILVNLEKYF